MKILVDADACPVEDEVSCIPWSSGSGPSWSGPLAAAIAST
jgi:hypothetical protein